MLVSIITHTVPGTGAKEGCMNEILEEIIDYIIGFGEVSQDLFQDTTK